MNYILFGILVVVFIIRKYVSKKLEAKLKDE